MIRCGVVAEKLGMSAIFTENGIRVSVTFLRIVDCQVIGKRTVDKHGYSALVIGAKNVKKNNKLSKPMSKFFEKNNLLPKLYIKEFRVPENYNLDVGYNLRTIHFSVNQYVDVTGDTIGKGFAGCMKRHNFSGLRATHGVSISHRSHGSTGQRQDPGKVFKNKKMAGHMGTNSVTIQNLQILEIDEEADVLVIKGAIPGSRGSIVVVRDAIKKYKSEEV